MKVLVLGSKPEKYGFGSSIYRAFLANNCEVTAVARPQVDFNNPKWIDVLSSVEFDVVIASAYDHRYPGMQLAMMKHLFEAYRHDPTKQIVAIGSMTHYYQKTDAYSVATKELHHYVLNVGKDSLSYECKLLLLEPGSMDNMLARKHLYQFTYSKLDETAQMLYQFVNMNLKFLHIALRGGLKSTDAP